MNTGYNLSYVLWPSLDVHPQHASQTPSGQVKYLISRSRFRSIYDPGLGGTFPCCTQKSIVEHCCQSLSKRDQSRNKYSLSILYPSNLSMLILIPIKTNYNTSTLYPNPSFPPIQFFFLPTFSTFSISSSTILLKERPC